MNLGLFVAPLILFIFGVIISTGKLTFSTSKSNLSENESKDRKCVSKFIGKLLLLMSLIQLLVPFSILLNFKNTLFVVITSTLLTSIMTVIAVIYMNTEANADKK